MTLKATEASRWRVLVTGAGGFLGRRLVPEMARLGILVVATGRQIPKEVEAAAEIVIRGNLGSPRVLTKALKALVGRGEPGQFRGVIHLAGLSDAELARADPLTAFEENVVRTYELLEACRGSKVRRFLFPSTGLVYGKRCRKLFTEDSPPRPGSFYAATKLAAETLIQGYAEDYGFSCDIVRLSNIYGPGSPDNTVFGQILRRIRARKEVRLRSLSPVRDFIYVDDVVTGFIRLLQTGGEQGYRVVNLSSGVGTAIGKLARTALIAAGHNHRDRMSSFGRTEDVVILSNERLETITGWKPSRTLIEGLRKSIL